MTGAAADSGRPLRFLMATTFYPPYHFGGDAVGIRRFSRALVARGHRVTVLHDVDAYRVLSGRDAEVGFADDEGVEVVRLGSRAPRLSALLTQQTGRPVVQGRAIDRLLARRGFDVLNFHNVSLLGGPGLLARGGGLKLYMAHEHWLVCPSHVLWRHGREPCTGRQCLRCVLHHRRPPQLWRYTGLLDRRLDHVDAFIAMSEFSRDKHREFGFRRDMEVVNYFLPEPAPAPADEPAAHPRPYFLFAGRLERLKGLDTVLPVFRRFDAADLVVCGSGEDEERLRAMAAGRDNIVFAGRVPRRDLERYYRQALALVVPSVGFETFGLILIEAFQQGTPVVARRRGPFPEIVERCGGGLLFDGEDDLARAITRLRADADLRRDMGRAARRGFEQHWSEAAVMPRYLEVVRESARRAGRHEIVEALS